jgi:protein-tyrosine phosphatase
MAEFVFKKLIADKGLSHKYFVASSATSTEEIGNPVYPPACAELARHGISSEGKYSVQLKTSDYEKYDLFVGMDSRNIANMTRIFGGDRDGKIRKLMDVTGRGGDVADPWFTGSFDVTYRDVCEGCETLLNILEEENK